MKKTILAIAFLLLLAGCERMFMPDEASATPTEVFEFLWRQTDRTYPFFTEKGVIWQQVYDTLRPRVSDDIPQDSLFTLCASMLRTLNDGHVNLYSAFDISHADSLYYNFYAHSQIDVNTVAMTYLGPDYHSTGGIAHNVLCDGRVVYMRYGSFSSGVSVGQLHHIIHAYPRAEGLVIDIRANGGGSIANIQHILSILPSHGQHLYSSQLKAGPAHGDFTPPVSTYAPVVADSDAFTGPVVVLTDRGCFSAASMFALCCRAYPCVTLLGDTTAGGLGLPTMGFLPNGWRYRLPVSRLLAPDGQNYENGVPPHRVLLLDKDAAHTHHRDNLIETACDIILSTSDNFQS